MTIDKQALIDFVQKNFAAAEGSGYVDMRVEDLADELAQHAAELCELLGGVHGYDGCPNCVKLNDEETPNSKLARKVI